MTEATERKVHQGRNVKRFREMLGMKQEALAQELGEDWTQKKISLMEAKEEIEPVLLEQVAKVLKVPSEAIKNFDDEAAINIISTSFTSHDNSTLTPQFAKTLNYTPTFNPVDKIVELYERMLKDKNEMIERLERMLQERK
jgi:transcriptional regulator with XRE-family HTH domain